MVAFWAAYGARNGGVFRLFFGQLQRCAGTFSASPTDFMSVDLVSYLHIVDSYKLARLSL